MLIGILQTGKVNPAIVGRHGEYPPMFEALFAEAAPEFRFRTHAVVDGEMPESVEDCDAWLVAGSKHGVYDDLPWIAPLEAFVREARAAGRPILGICFGHQLLAQAFGGRVVKSEKGWGLGPEGYRILRRPGWMADAPEEIVLHAIHQDQVVDMPADATLLAESDHCPCAMLAYGDPEAPDAVGIQPHPECRDAYVADLAAVLGREGRAPATITERARDAVGRPLDSAAFARWAAAFLRLKVRGERAA